MSWLDNCEGTIKFDIKGKFDTKIAFRFEKLISFLKNDVNFTKEEHSNSREIKFLKYIATQKLELISV